MRADQLERQRQVARRLEVDGGIRVGGNLSHDFGAGGAVNTVLPGASWALAYFLGRTPDDR